MFRLTFSVVLALAFAAPSWAAGWADALFVEHQKDFGAVPRGPMLTHPFHFTNTTGQPISIGGARVSCGCTSAVVLKNYLNPGESTAVVATMDTSRFAGPKTVTIYVSFQQPQFDEARLYVTANGRDDLYISPEGFQFGKVRQGKSPTGSVSVTLYGDSQAKIVSQSCDSNFVELNLKEQRRGPSDVTYQLDARVSPKTPVGKWYTEIWLKTANPSMPRVRVPVGIEIEPPPPPTKVSFDEVRVGEQAERQFLIQGDKPFRVTVLEGADDQLLVKDSKEEPRTEHTLTFTLKPTKQGEINRLIKIRTDLKDLEEVEFEARAKVLPKAPE